MKVYLNRNKNQLFELAVRRVDPYLNFYLVTLLINEMRIMKDEATKSMSFYKKYFYEHSSYYIGDFSKDELNSIKLSKNISWKYVFDYLEFK